MAGMKDLKFGVEIEMTGITKKQAAEVIASKLGGKVRRPNDFSKSWEARTALGTWKVVSDGSIRVEGGESVEVNTPPLQYKDLETLQEVVRALRQAGAKVNESCGVHIHVDASAFTAKALRNLLKIWTSKEELVFAALVVNEDRRRRYTKPIRQIFKEESTYRRMSSMESVKEVWYAGQNPDFASVERYNGTRYHALNLHSVWFRGTIEFRCFNGTLHAGEIKAYVQFCLAVAAQALRQGAARISATQMENPKYAMWHWMWQLGLVGDEFKTCRHHMMKHLWGNAGHRYEGRVARCG